VILHLTYLYFTISKERHTERRLKKIKADANKVEWFDALTEVLNMGFDLDENSARDLLGTVNELRRIRQEKENKDLCH